MNIDNYINTEISSLSDEKTFIKTLRNSLLFYGNFNEQEKITCDKTEEDIEEAYSPTDGSAPFRIQLTFTIFNILKMKIYAYSSNATAFNASSTYLYFRFDQINDNFYFNKTLSFSSNNNTLSPSTTNERKIKIKIAHCSNGIYLCFYPYDNSVNNSFNIFCLKKNNNFLLSVPETFSSSSYAGSAPEMPFQSTRQSIIYGKSQHWMKLKKCHRLNYIFNSENYSQLEILKNKIFFDYNSSTADASIIYTTDTLYDCSYSPNLFAVYTIDSDKFLTLDNYTLLKLESISENPIEGG